MVISHTRLSFQAQAYKSDPIKTEEKCIDNSCNTIQKLAKPSMETLKAYYTLAFTGIIDNIFGPKSKSKTQQIIQELVEAIKNGKVENLKVYDKDPSNDDFAILFTYKGKEFEIESFTLLEASLGATAAPIKATKYALTVHENKDKFDSIYISAEQWQSILNIADDFIEIKR
ncbi:MAG: hypothetical protein AB1782_12345 [Cyanobacteriota bacterium]